MFQVDIGIDEAGIGTLAGPMVAAVVVLPKDVSVPGVRDSKKMNDASRERCVDAIYDIALYSEIMFASNAQIDSDGIWKCWDKVIRNLIFAARDIYPRYTVLIDGNRLIPDIRKIVPVVGGDNIHPCISAASVLAKYAQCNVMDDIHKQYPEYGFNRHRGYGTVEHLRALQRVGPCKYHRMSYDPVKAVINF